LPPFFATACWHLRTAVSVIGPVVAVLTIGGPFAAAGVMKLVYDLALLRTFGPGRRTERPASEAGK